MNKQCSLQTAIDLAETPVNEVMREKGRGKKFLLELAEHYRFLYLAKAESVNEWAAYE